MSAQSSIAERFPYRIRIQKRLDNPRWLSILSPVVLVIGALIVGGVLLSIVGVSPFVAYSRIFRAAFGTPAGWLRGELYPLSDTTIKATPLLLAGLSVALAFRMQLWNIGAEGQLLIGAWAATGVALKLLSPDTPAFIMIPAMMLAAFLAGGLYGAVPGALKAWLGVNLIITTLMLNYVAAFWNNFFIYGPWSLRGFGLTPKFPRTAWLPRLTEFADQLPILRGLTAHAGILIGLAAAFILWYVLRKSKFGYEIKVIGDNPEAARYAGMNIKRNILLVMLISGGLAGLAGMAEVSGVIHIFQERISPGYGFTAIIVAWLAKLNPWGVVLVAYLFGGLLVGGDEIQPFGIVSMLNGVILFVVVGGELLLRYRVRVERSEPVVQPAAAGGGQ
ncbi:MAG: ABC transporter permease [Anaerolineales bacterium]